MLEHVVAKLIMFYKKGSHRRSRRSLRMDQGNACSLKDNKKMDANTVWQWRIMHVKKYSRDPEPFHDSDKMKLDFNVGSKRQKKLDLHSVTNGIILEVCDFAETVTKSKRHFITNILENNFDLGLKNEQQRIEFTSRILHKVRDLMRQPPKDKHEAFSLFDPSSEPECTSNSKNELNVASDSFLVDMDDADQSEHEKKFKCSRAPSKETIATEEMDGPFADDSDDDDDELIYEYSEPQTTEELKEDVLPPLFPYCQEIGLNLDVGSKQSLDPGLLTKGMMLELVHFSRALTSSYKSIVLSVLEHNFEFDLKSQQERNRVWFIISQLLNRRKQLLTTGTKISAEFKSETFSFQTNSFKRESALSSVGTPLHQFKEVTKRRQSDLKRKQEQRALSTTREGVAKRRRTEQVEKEETNTLCHHTDVCTSQTSEVDLSYMCPLDLDEVTDSENDENEDDLENPTSSEFHSESESSCLGVRGSFLTTTDGSSSLPLVDSNVNSSSASQPDERGLCGDQEKTQIPRNVSHRSDMEEEEMETESNMWKLRANRVEQILSLLDKAFTKSRIFGLDFNVGFGSRQNFSIDTLTTFVLLEVAKFALAMNSSQQDFIMEILEYNFDLGLWSEQQRKTFACEVMNRVRQLKNSEDSVKLSKQVFQLPGLVSSLNMANQSMDRVNPEVSSISRAAECDVAPLCSPDSHTGTKEHRVELYPFCKDIGLKLNVISSQPIKKLELNKLTNGAMTEVTNFAEKLCGTFEQICLDLLRHNFDLDCRHGDSDLAKNILARIPVIMEHKNLSNLTGFKKVKHTKKVFSMMVMDGQYNPNLDTCSTGSSQAPIRDQNVVRSTDNNQEDVLNLLLWKLRDNQIQQILSVPHGEHCPLYSYSRSKKLGIDFNVGSGVKQNLDPKLLTNGLMVEINTLATALHSTQKDFITEILEYNFHLNLNHELCRSVFAKEVLDKFMLLRSNCKKSRFLKMPFELPDSRVVDESSYPKTKYCPKCYQDRNYKLHQDESDPDHVLHARPHAPTESVSAEANRTAQMSAKDQSSAFQAAEETIMDSYPQCKKIGLGLCVDNNKPKVKLDTCVLTWGVIKEVVTFAKRLCGTIHMAVNDVLYHNFDIGEQSRDINPALLFHRMVALHDKGPTWFNEVYVIHSYPHKDLRDVSKQKAVCAAQKNERKEAVRKRQLALQTKKKEATLLGEYRGALKSKKYKQGSGKCSPICTDISLAQDSQNPTNGPIYHTDVCTSQTAEGDHTYMCPLDSDEVTDSENNENEDDLENSIRADIHSESESSCLGTHEPFLTTTDGSSSLPLVNSNVNSSSASQPDERGLCGDEEKKDNPGKVSYKCDMEEEEMETESNMWKLRANRVEQILFSLDKEYCAFKKSKKCGLQFNVGFSQRKNFSIDSLNNGILLEVAKFALAMNSSQQDFIMEILEYNFDFGLWSEQQRKTFACEVMNRVRQLKNSEDSVKLSKQVFQLLGPVSSLDMANQCMDSVNPEVSSISRAAECDVAPLCSPDSHTETKEHRVELYPFCKDIGLKLNVISSQPNKKLELNKLTNGAMTEVTNFAEKLCGTFEQICLDILRHNFDLNWQNGDSELAKNILARIPLMVEHKNLSNVTGYRNIIKDFSTMVMDCQNNPNLDICNVGSSQAPIIDQNVRSSTDNQENYLDLVLWKCRANQIQQILSVPHVEHCPLYSYSRSKKLGIDFNVGSGVKRNLDTTLLTNGIMLEVYTLATALHLAQKDYIIDILEYNFHLNLKNDRCRSVFAQQVMAKKKALAIKVCKAANKSSFMKMPFELPDSRCIDESTHPKTKYCPKCYQDRNDKLHQDESDPDHVLHPRPHALTESAPAEANCTKDLSSAFQAAEETMMDSYPLCKKVGLSLFVDKNKSKDKLDTRLLTRGVMREVAHFTHRLCGRKIKLINDVLEHNFNFGTQSQDINPALLFHKMVGQNNKGLTWFSEVFVVYPYPPKEPGDVSKKKEVSAAQKNERKETVRKRQLALQTKKEEATLLSECMSAVKSKKKKRGRTRVRFPVCSEIGLDLDVTSQSGHKKKLNLELLTRAAMMEIYRFVIDKVGQYFPGIVYDILDYNFDLSSQHYRRWEFSIATASEVKSMVKQYRKNPETGNEVFKLPFVFEHKASKRPVQKRQNRKSAESRVEKTDKTKNVEGRAVRQLRYLSDVNHVYLLDVKTYKELCTDGATTKQTQRDPGTILQMSGNPVSDGRESLLQGNLQIKEEEEDPHYGDIKPEPDTEEKYHPHCEDVKTEPSTDDVKYLIQGEPTGSLEYNLLTICPKSESNVKTESETEDAQYYNVAEPQASEGYAMLAVHPKTESGVKTESDTEGIKSEIKVEAAGSQGYSMITICQDTESTLM